MIEMFLHRQVMKTDGVGGSRPAGRVPIGWGLAYWLILAPLLVCEVVPGEAATGVRIGPFTLRIATVILIGALFSRIHLRHRSVDAALTVGAVWCVLTLLLSILLSTTLTPAIDAPILFGSTGLETAFTFAALLLSPALYAEGRPSS